MFRDHITSIQKKLFGLLDKQAEANLTAAIHLKDLMEYFRRSNLKIKNTPDFSDKEHGLIISIINQRELSHFVRKIREVKQEGHKHFAEFTGLLSKTLFTPIDSDDLYYFSQEIHSIIGHMYSAAFRIELYEAKWPDKFCYKLVNVLVDMTEESKAAINILKKMGKVRPHLEKMTKLERKGSEAYIEGMSILFKTEDEMEVLKWNDVYIRLRQAIRCTTALAERMESIIIKYA